jgi:hypothetical protein
MHLAGGYAGERRVSVVHPSPVSADGLSGPAKGRDVALTNDERFDDLARKLAQPRTRRGAIRVAAGGLGGLLLGAFGIRASGVEAQRGPGNPCHAWCNANYHTRAEITACIAAANKGQGPCYECGAAAPPDSPPFCDGVCCEDGQVCENGECVDNCIFNEEGGACFGQTSCGDTGPYGCWCAEKYDGDARFCYEDRSCGDVVDCATDADCPAGYGCVLTCCGVLKCFPPCGTTAEAVTAAAASGARGGPA